VSLAFWTVTYTIKGLTRMLCRVEGQALEQVPARGPLILVCNHINSIEVPLMFTHLQPRPVTGFVKSETWDNPWMSFLFDLWGAIPVQRGEADTSAMRKGLHVLEKGYILTITPEGTRNQDGQLRPGRPGVISMAQHSHAPLLPLVYYGHEEMMGDLRRLKRAEFHIAVGRPFYLDFPSGKITHAVRQEMTDEIMYQLAGLLPPRYRGVYGDLSGATTRYLNFISPSNLA
jgi:1-acyl-sn-glycerol-3-phosphate acyltransferase